ncbi:cupin domain-containing protein [Saccharothrix violaceirubra]|uniref:Mannose-6-phosphate isomerase-like protein (Cupin superfamily) n=1 Tax=Saccharothrix violaceirubra TaxID=413306 RepID=A0A7W7WXN5_9PSEU|nr:cupin domain-containing protein [Saccharothrix violaceirubra]MBB4967322.1 mannose-6-phosphate isomerase-like protein (cupin superfamily) [Saccharothrix violaceirubra]
MSGLIVADTASAADVYDVHGASGRSAWKCFARRTWLHGDWEAVEWARIPPGGMSGEHVHTRTEEVYLILSGRGQILLDGVATEVGPGDVVLTGLGTRHGLRASADEGVTWLVIEILGPTTAAVLRGGAS